jgi:NAD-dependent dihydropyrimidine dehydrogenase PreA subunit
MLIDEATCTACHDCVPYCTVDAIKIDEGGGPSYIDLDLCVECDACRRADVCPTDSFYQQPLEWPRILRSQFSNPTGEHPKTMIAGRGTEEIKTNDITNRVKPGFVGIAAEMGRPSVGVRLWQVEKVAMALCKIGVELEPANPVTWLMPDPKTGKMREDVLNERALSAIVEFVVPESKAIEALTTIKEALSGLNTVASIDVAVRYNPDGTRPLEREMVEADFDLSVNGKVNVGLIPWLKNRNTAAGVN